MVCSAKRKQVSVAGKRGDKSKGKQSKGEGKIKLTPAQQALINKNPGTTTGSGK